MRHRCLGTNEKIASPSFLRLVWRWVPPEVRSRTSLHQPAPTPCFASKGPRPRPVRHTSSSSWSPGSCALSSQHYDTAELGAIHGFDPIEVDPRVQLATRAIANVERNFVVTRGGSW